MKSQGHHFLQAYRRRVAKIFGPLGPLSGIFLLLGVDAHRRYRAVAMEVREGSVLDVGAGGKSFLSLILEDCVSVDLRKAPGLDVRASATHLPFRSDSVDCVVSVDTIEHIAPPNREVSLGEMKRVARTLVVIHAPVENGTNFAGRRSDIAFDEWHRKVKGEKELNVDEHIINVEPSPREFEEQGFSLKGTHNAELWLSYMRLSYSFIWPIGPVLGQLYYFFKRKLDSRPPFWGAVCIYVKSPSLVKGDR